MVFRNGGKIKVCEKWLYDGKPIEIVNNFIYLGLLFNYNGKFNSTQKYLSSQGRKAMFSLLSNIKICCFNIETQLSLFDTYVSSVLGYSCELWGFDKSVDIEKIHLQFCKKLLCVRKTTSNNMIYFELGRLPLQFFRQIRIIKYWLKLLKTDNCILRSCYKELLCRIDTNCKFNWLRNVRDLLSTMGFHDIWLMQFVDNEKLFLSVFLLL